MELKTSVIRRIVIICFLYISGYEVFATIESAVETNLKFHVASNIRYMSRRGDSEKQPYVFNTLYFESDKMVIYTQLYSPEDDSLANRLILMQIYGSLGHTPAVTLRNQSWSRSFTFTKTGEDVDVWQLSITRSDVTGQNTPSLPLGQWEMTVELDEGTGLYATSGTFIDIASESILQWKLGTAVENYTFFNTVTNMKQVQNPCSLDIGVMAVLRKVTPHGIYIAHSVADKYVWFDLLDAVCHLFDQGCSSVFLMDAVLTNAHLLLVTNRGLLVSERLDNRNKVGRPQLQFTLTNPYQNFTSASRFEEGLDLDDPIHVEYAPVCYNLQGPLYNDTVIILMKPNKEQQKNIVPDSLIYSTSPYVTWKPVYSFSNDVGVFHYLQDILSAAFSYHQQMFSVLYKAQNQTKVAIIAVKNTPTNQSDDHGKMMAPDFIFPKSFTASGMQLHPVTQDMYAYGNQIWISIGGVNSYLVTQDLIPEDDEVESCYFSYYVLLFGCLTKKQTVLIGKNGIARILSLKRESWMKNQVNIFPPFTLALSFVGNLYLYSRQLRNGSYHLFATEIAKELQSVDSSFPQPLAIHFLSEKEVIFHEHRPFLLEHKVNGREQLGFTANTIGQVIHQRNGGTAFIKQVMETHSVKSFKSSALTEVLTPFHHESLELSPAQKYEITIMYIGDNDSEAEVTMALHSDGNSDGWLQSDVGKTVAVAEMSCLITEVINASITKGHAVLNVHPVNHTMSAPAGMWYIFNFGSQKKKSDPGEETIPWQKGEDKCRHKIHPALEKEARSFYQLDLGDTLVTMVIAYTWGNDPVPARIVPLIHLTVSNPKLLLLRSNEAQSDFHHFMMHSIEGHTYRQGVTMLTYRLLGASLLCDKTSYSVLLHMTAPVNKMLRFSYPYPITISPYDILLAEPLYKGQKLFQTLEVNYRPPSRFGREIPTSPHIYNADPSQNIPHNYYKISKRAGNFKQCKKKSSRSDCKCTPMMQLSSLVEYSDCKQKVFLMQQPVDTSLLLTLQLDISFTIPLNSPYFVYVTEVNNRTEFSVHSNETKALSILKKHPKIGQKKVLHDPASIRIQITGVELFHFRIKVIEDVTFAELFDDFQVFVETRQLSMTVLSVLMVLCIFIMCTTLLVVLIVCTIKLVRNIKMSESEKKDSLQEEKSDSFQTDTEERQELKTNLEIHNANRMPSFLDIAKSKSSVRKFAVPKI